MRADQPSSQSRSSAEGPYCRMVQRRISGPVSAALAPRLRSNAVTAIDLATGLAAAACVVAGAYVAAAVLVQLFGVLSCADGEVARLRDETSEVGDFIDTMTDRVVEVFLVVAMVAQLERDCGGALWPGLFLLAGTLLLVVSSEKFRSAFGTAYPKGQWERTFAWISAGSDVRLLALTVALLVWTVAGSASALVVIRVLAVAVCLNVAWRAFVLIRRLRGADRLDGLGGS